MFKIQEKVVFLFEVVFAVSYVYLTFFLQQELLDTHGLLTDEVNHFCEDSQLTSSFFLNLVADIESIHSVINCKKQF